MTDTPDDLATNGFQEYPGAKPLDERAKTIPGHVERLMLRDYSPVNDGFHILYDAAELLRRYSKRIEALESRPHSVRAAALEEAAVIAETWFDHHRPQQPKKSRFNIYDIEHWAKSATRLVAEDIRALASAPPAVGGK